MKLTRIRSFVTAAFLMAGLSAFADSSVTIIEVKTDNPWDSRKGTITVDYSLGGLDSKCKYKVAFDITANDQTARVTNDAAKLTEGNRTQTFDTVKLFGEVTFDENAKVGISLIAEPKVAGVQLWENGPYFADCNIGAETPGDYGNLFQFHTSTRMAETVTAALGEGWYLPSRSEWSMLLEMNYLTQEPYCDGIWTTCKDSANNDVYGYRFTGRGDYASKSIFLPAAGYDRGKGGGLEEVGTNGYYWSTVGGGGGFVDIFCFSEKELSVYEHVDMEEDYQKYQYFSIRAIREAPEKEKIVATGGTTFRLGPNCGPWTAGDGVTAHAEDKTLFINGAGAVTLTPWAGDSAWITKLQVAEGVTDLGETMVTLPSLTSVNGLSLGVFNSAAAGAVKTKGFNAIVVDPTTRKATLTLVVKTAATVDAEEKDWTVAATEDVEVDASAPAGFFFVAPAK